MQIGVRWLRQYSSQLKYSTHCCACTIWGFQAWSFWLNRHEPGRFISAGNINPLWYAAGPC